MTRNLIMYSRSYGCPFITIARRVLEEQSVVYREIFIDKDPAAQQRVQQWTGFLSVPTLVAAEGQSLLPVIEPAPLSKGTSPRGIHRGAMITEPNEEQLKAWLVDNGFMTAVSDAVAQDGANQGIS